MNNTILIIGLALIEISVLCFGLGFYILIKAKLKAYETENNTSKLIGEQYTKIISSHNDMYEQYQRIYEQYNAIRSQYQKVINCDHKIDEDFLKLLEAWKVVEDRYQKVINCDHKIDEDFLKLLEAWKAVEDHYSDAYEQFKEYNARLKTLEQKIDKIMPPEIDFRIDPPVINGVIFDHDEPLV